MTAARFRQRLDLVRKAWTVAVLTGGVLLSLSAIYYLYIAFVSYVIEHTGVISHTGADTPAFRVVLALAPLFDAAMALLQLGQLVLWLVWIWFAVALARRAEPGSVRYAPWTAVAGFVIPVVNLWIAFFTLADLGAANARVEGRVGRDFPWQEAALVIMALLVFGLWHAVNAVAPGTGFDAARNQSLMQLAATSAIANLAFLMLAHGFIDRMRPGQAIALDDLAALEASAQEASATD